VCGPAVAQLWLFWVAPLIGGALGAAIYKYVGCECCGGTCEKKE
jgi:aquaporin Z